MTNSDILVTEFVLDVRIYSFQKNLI